MRVVHVAQSIAGGIGAYFEEIAAYQNDAFGKENVFFVVPKGSEAHLSSIDADQLITFRGRRRTPFDIIAFGISAIKAVGHLNPEIVHLHSSFAGAIVRPLLATRRRRPAIVYCPHGWAFGMETTNLKRFVYAEYERALVKWTDLVVVNSDAERRLAVHYGIPARKTTTVKNGISADRSRQLERMDGEKRRGPINVAFIGRHDRQKGLDILLGAVDDLSGEHLHFHVVGKGILDPKYAPQRRYRDNVTFYGWLARPDIFALLRQMDVVIVPSRWEAFGLVAVEAMRCGLPVIASNRGALPEIIRDGIDGYVFDIDEPGALSDRLRTLDRAELSRMGQAARARFEAEFTSNRMNARLQRAYENVLEAIGKPARNVTDGVAGPARA